ncbi:hypothetical protein C0Q70_00228 [Pomacea canaliculata]|uniref:FZ domain-containing protein n=1 Tax=Pomacea canaliculata TaxID=400727 RepID=A0A2T7PW36_POMCA|nr:uncharacterized protein LOC112566770 [Pomacea canaliculata]PVD37631.1 hypothetical protein C0Q70_00228 [Pomacea canaliculata]
MATAVTVVVLTLISVSSRTMSTSARGPQPGYSDVNSRCQPLGHGGPCSVSGPPRGVALPNLYGHLTVLQAEAEVKVILNNMTTSVRGYMSSEFVRPFLCTLYLPPCLDSTHDEDAVSRMRGLVLLPCRPLCEMAKEEVKRMGNGLPSDGSRDRAGSWPSNIRCHMFPTERCFTLQGPGEVKLVQKSLIASGVSARLHDVLPKSVAPLESELGDEEPFDVQVVSLGTNHVPPRRYDLTDLGDPAYFQGWADVQGTGAANDYCRVIGKGRRRFLSCALAGTAGHDHQYVSKLGFEPGQAGTWFMRDVDNDGRDDYCRCLGLATRSRVVCMKAGEKGFYGSTVQGGNEDTFELPGSDGCSHKRLNPHFGI